MLDANLKQQLQGLLTNLREPIELISSLGDDAKSAELASLLDEIAALVASTRYKLRFLK